MLLWYGFPLNPKPRSFIGWFDVYDQEDTLGKELNQYDPNNEKDRTILIQNYCIDGFDQQKGISYRHKFTLVRALEDALKDKDYDFAAVLAHNPEECALMPWEWNIKDPRGFFEAILKIAKESWKKELYKASLEDPNTW